MFALAVNGTESDVFDELLSKGSLWHCLGVGAWVQRFINNTRDSEYKRKTGALTTEEIKFVDDKLKRNLQMNHDGALECR